MNSVLCDWLFKLAPLRVLKILLHGRPMGIREVAALCDLSPRGAQIVLNNLASNKLVQRKKEGRLVFYSLSLSPEDQRQLQELSSRLSRQNIVDRAERCSKKSALAVGWVDEMVKMWQRGKRDAASVA